MPFKGNSRVNNIINVILDTSGSMGGYYEKALSYIFQDECISNVVQVDTQVYDTGLVKSKQALQRMRIKGGGGTMLQPAIELVKEKYNKYNTVILTDGCTDTLNFDGVRGKVVILSVDQKTPIGTTNGKVKNIVVTDKYDK
jgi:predicted metal-dependent peptidase